MKAPCRTASRLRLSSLVGVGVLVAILLSPSAIAALGFSKPSAIDPSEEYAGYVEMATDGNGEWIAVWDTLSAMGYVVVVSRSTDNGKTWTAPESLSKTDPADTISDSSPSIATDGSGNWIVVWNSQGRDEAYWYQLYATRSSDDGQTWSAPSALTPNPDYEPCNIYSPLLATDRAGRWVVAWESEALNVTEDTWEQNILSSYSVNTGATWSVPHALNSAAEDAADLINSGIKLATDRNGNWVAVWAYGDPYSYNSIIRVSRSTDNAGTWSPPVAIEPGANVYDDVYDLYPDIATDGGGHWVAIWPSLDISRFHVRVARSTDNGATWTRPADVFSAKNAIADSVSVANDGQGHWLAGWSFIPFFESKMADIVVSLSTDNGAKWSPADQLDKGARSDEYYAWGAPDIKTDGSGHWVAGWIAIGEFFSTVPLISTSDFTAGNRLTLLEPNGKEHLKKGNKARIQWLSVGNVGENVSIELFRNGSLARVIAASTPNDGLLKWKVPADVERGKGYRIEVTSILDSGINDQSDASFSIKSVK